MGRFVSWTIKGYMHEKEIERVVEGICRNASVSLRAFLLYGNTFASSFPLE